MKISKKELKNRLEKAYAKTSYDKVSKETIFPAPWFYPDKFGTTSRKGGDNRNQFAAEFIAAEAGLELIPEFGDLSLNKCADIIFEALHPKKEKEIKEEDE